VSRSFLDSIESAAVRQILERFPTTEELARNINTSNWSETIFTSKIESNGTFVTVPKNIEEFRDSLMMMSILKIFELKQWIPVLSEKELPKAVLETKEGAFFAGFVAASTREFTGPCEPGTSKYNRGVRAYQLFCIEKKFGKASHLRSGGLEAISARLSEMKGFTQAYWGLRSTVTTLFKSLKPIEVSDLHTFVKSKEELLKSIKTRLHFENGGCFRPEELRYLSERYNSVKETLNAFLRRIERPDEELAQHFDELYAPVKTAIDRADSEIKANLASRARILFPNDNKKRTQQWVKKPLAEKILDLSEDKRKEFLPETLPGVLVRPVPVEGNTQQRNKAILQRYAGNDGQAAQEVILSWYANFEPEGDEE
jgi:hypothetical protein